MKKQYSGDCTPVATQPRQLHYSNNLSKKKNNIVECSSSGVSTLIRRKYTKKKTFEVFQRANLHYFIDERKKRHIFCFSMKCDKKP